ncbi:General stress protein 16O [Caloramator mitchellensis]|uniref:General stress protein 16O n=1 Tax=Caloramator mitchellensis TaxID=908809 RepID=A0A0R3K0V4_CALMK|nr:TraR/DksA C4-type zinc finger protein [Caloramator mitchellensis]KRQ86549.1 General stress protein 16O [Caloramator mitchellensis]
MEASKIEKYKGKLQNERENLMKTINSMYESGLAAPQREEIGELSVNDNHPADVGTEMFDKERGFALLSNEKNMLVQIDNALERIENGNYGVCEVCGKEIEEERLDFLPYASRCVKCENEKVNHNTFRYDRPVEEGVLNYPFGRSFNDISESVEYDGEDAWQDVDEFNKIPKFKRNYEDEYISGTVEETDNISNQQYKNQLP